MENEIKRGRKKKEIDGNFAKLLSELLQNVKTEKGIIQDDVAKAIGVSRQALGKWANGETVPDILDLKKLAIYFDISADYLLGLTNNATTDANIQAVCDYTGLNEDAVRELNFTFDSVSQPEALDSKESEYVTELLKTLSWLISERHIYEIIYRFLLIKKYSQQYMSFEESLCNSGLYSIDDKISEQTELNNISKLQEIEKNIDFERYNLSRFIEKLLNCFDQREYEIKLDGNIKRVYSELHMLQIIKDDLQYRKNSGNTNVPEVSNDGKHNPPKE